MMNKLSNKLIHKFNNKIPNQINKTIKLYSECFNVSILFLILALSLFYVYSFSDDLSMCAPLSLASTLLLEI